MKDKQKKDLFKLSSTVLFIIGLVDILRGFMHTFVLTWSASNFAKLDLTNGSGEQVFLLGVFGISNFLTGFIYLLISKKAKALSPYVLIIIPLTYLLGLIGIWSGGVRGAAAYEGKYFLIAYFAVCILTFISFIIQKKTNKIV